MYRQKCKTGEPQVVKDVINSHIQIVKYRPYMGKKLLINHLLH